jgi:ATP-dependent Clp protease adaptor protein ClpS
MLQVHHDGKGICGIYTYDVAETKVAQVNEYARSQEHPLLCVMEAI